MKKHHLLLLAIFTLISCQNEDLFNSETILGSWNFRGEYDSDDKLILTNDCAFQSIVSYNQDKSFISTSYKLDNNTCTNIQDTRNIVHSSFKYENDTLTTYVDHFNGLKIKSYWAKNKIRFINQDRFEGTHLDRIGRPTGRKTVWVRNK